jgi:hypothetical protein
MIAIEDPATAPFEQSATKAPPAVRRIEIARAALYPEQEAAIYEPVRISIIEAATKSGKAQPLDALVFTPSGPVKMGSLKAGMEVCTPTGTARIVSIHPQGIQDIYRVNLSDDTWAECTLDHLWEVSAGTKRDYRHDYYARSLRGETPTRRKDFQGWPRIMTLAELLKFSVRSRRRLSIRPLPQYQHYRTLSCPIDPYLLGVILGDGCITGDGISVSTGDPEILDAVARAIPPWYGVKLIGGYDYKIKLKVPYQLLRPKQRLQHRLRELGLMGLHSYEKFVPDRYLYNHSSVRRAILQGLMDTDGWCYGKYGQPEFSSTSKQLADGVAELVRSLGGIACIGHTGRRRFYRKPDGSKVLCRASYHVRISIDDPEDCFRLPRKRAVCQGKKKRICRTFREIKLMRRAPAQCIKLDDGIGLYLTDSHIITHNTSGCIQWLFERAYMGNPGAQYWWIAPVGGTARIAFERSKRGIPKDAYRANESRMSMWLTDVDTTVTFKGADRPESLYGEDVFAAVLDESSRMKASAWWAIRSTLTHTKGPMRIIGNRKGRHNWSYKLAREAEKLKTATERQAAGMAYHKITAKDAIRAGLYDEDEYRQARMVLPERVFRELYDVEDTGDDNNPFGFAAIEACKLAGGLSKKPAVCWGWDLAKHVDYTVGVGLDEDGHVARFERWQKKPWPVTWDLIISITAGARALIDSTGVGDPSLDALHERGGSNFEGYVYTNKSKQQLMDGLASSLQNRGVRYDPDACSALVLELESFEYLYRENMVIYSAPDGTNDDTVNALGLADHLRRESCGGRSGLGVVSTFRNSDGVDLGSIGRFHGSRRGRLAGI